jgi:hypothetical protein
MKTLLTRMLTVAALAAGAAGCDSGNVTVPTPAAIVTEAFTGTLGEGVTLTHAFEVPVRGTVAAQIIGMDPTDAGAMGFSLGTWDGTTCTPILRITAAQLGSALAGTAQPSNMCVTVFDVGNYVDDAAVTYVVSVTHPAIVTVQ